MQITMVHYSALVNTGNYENEKIGLDARLEDGETVAAVIERLKQMAFDELHRPELIEERRQLRYDLKVLTEKIAEAREQWDRTAEFMRAQGLRPDAPAFPTFSRMLTSTEERVAVEIIEE